MKKVLNLLWQYIPMLLILVISTLTYIEVSRNLNADLKHTQNSNIANKIKSHKPMYSLSDVNFSKHELLNINPTQSLYNISAKTAIQFEDDSSYKLEGIKIINKKNTDNKKEGDVVTTINSTSASINKSFDMVDMQSSTISIYNIDNDILTTLIGPHVILEPKTDIITLDQNATISRYQKNELTHILQAQNITFDNIKHNAVLSGKVKAVFYPPKKSIPPT
jgi:hypothetical protein